METVVAVLGALFGILATYGILFLSDRFWDTPKLLRMPLSLLGGAVFAWFAYRWAKNWLWNKSG